MGFSVREGRDGGWKVVVGWEGVVEWEMDGRGVVSIGEVEWVRFIR